MPSVSIATILRFSGKTAVVAEVDKILLVKWLENLPTVPSHYCRNSPAYQEKKFLEPGTTLAQLHRDYKQAAEDGGYRAVCIKIFNEIFHKLNYSIFIPRKDQCDTCISAKHGNIDEDSYQSHIQAKEVCMDS